MREVATGTEGSLPSLKPLMVPKWPLCLCGVVGVV